MKKLLCLLLPTFLLVSCAGVGSSDTKRMLSASGFQPKSPQTEKQTELYNSMEPYKLYNKEINGMMLHGYKDPEQGVALSSSAMAWKGGFQPHPPERIKLYSRNG